MIPKAKKPIGRFFLLVSGIMLLPIGLYGLWLSIISFIIVILINTGADMLAGFLASLIPQFITDAIYSVGIDLPSPADVISGGIGSATSLVTRPLNLFALTGMAEGAMLIALGIMGIKHHDDTKKAKFLGLLTAICALAVAAAMMSALSLMLFSAIRFTILAAFFTGVILNLKFLHNRKSAAT